MKIEDLQTLELFEKYGAVEYLENEKITLRIKDCIISTQIENWFGWERVTITIKLTNIGSFNTKTLLYTSLYDLSNKFKLVSVRLINSSSEERTYKIHCKEYETYFFSLLEEVCKIVFKENSK